VSLPDLTIQVHLAGEWHDAAVLELAAKASISEPTHLEYLPEYVLDHLHAQDRRAVSCAHPVTYALWSLETFPAFTLDLMPQGEARRMLVARLREEALAPTDWNVLARGAAAPVGNLRVREAVRAPPPSPGFDRDAVIARGDAFKAWAESEGIPMHGSSDTGGAAPKLLLTADEDGAFHADGALPDERAARHYLVKFPRGRTRRDAQVLANEAPYYEVARGLGLRCGEPLDYEDGTLWVPRFDREVDVGVHRSGVESAYSLVGETRPGAALRFEDLAATLAGVVDAPHADLGELVRRDAVALALGDTDNHGRNHSIRKGPDGGVALSPLYDFAPMFLDPELVKRRTTWRSEPHIDWSDVCESLEPHVPRALLAPALVDLGRRLEDAPRLLREHGVDDEIITRRERPIAEVAAALRSLA